MAQETTVKDFDRQELQGIRGRASVLGKEVITNALWKRAYLKLADAADCLDAMVARTQEKLEDQAFNGE